MTCRRELAQGVKALIENPGKHAEVERDALLDAIARWQAEHIPEYGRMKRRGSLPPALPTDVFRFRRIAAHPEAEDVRVFRSSGTTSSDRSTHFFRDLELYALAARSAAKHMLFPDVERMRMILLAPHEREAPSSSLSYMLTRFVEWFGADAVWVWCEDALQVAELRAALQSYAAEPHPVALLGTSFAFVHAEDRLGDLGVELSAGSRIMHTGGYKGRSRKIEPAALRRAMTERYGIEEPWIIAEYGMTELSSQLYETTLRDNLTANATARRLWVPPWVRAMPVDPDTLEPTAEETRGVLRLDDAANLDSVACIQTADLAHRLDDGIVVLGRAPGATLRGCSLAADQALGEPIG